MENNELQEKKDKKPEEKTYFQEHWKDLLKIAGLTKAEFCRKMGVKPQNFDKLVKTKNAITLTKVSKVIGLPVRPLIDGGNDDLCDKDTIFGCMMIHNRVFFVNGVQDFNYMMKQIFPSTQGSKK